MRSFPLPSDGVSLRLFLIDMELFTIHRPTAKPVPIVLSSPHSGTFFPENVRERFRPDKIQASDDSDWYIDKLYDFAPSMGITMICANYSRWVIDLNRDPLQQPLYSDGRVITGLVPTTDFNGNPLYQNELPTQTETEQRVNDYFMPYHKQVEQLLLELRDTFGQVLLFDAHSIRKTVPGIQAAPFPDLILGDNDQNSCGTTLTTAAFGALHNQGYELSHNHPFKGGFITRSFGRPHEHIHAMQLEMAKINYMDDSEIHYHADRANRMRNVLQDCFSALIKELQA